MEKDSELEAYIRDSRNLLSREKAYAQSFIGVAEHKEDGYHNIVDVYKKPCHKSCI